MKLTNLSLSVLVALGLVACGGSSSDNKDDGPIDPIDPPKVDGGSEDKPKVVDGVEVKPRDPSRAIPEMKIEPNLVADVKAKKDRYIDRQNRNAIAGYNGWYADQNANDTRTAALASDDWEKLTKKAWGEAANNVPRAAVIGNQGKMTYNPGSTNEKDILRASSIYNYYEFQKEEGSLNKDGGIHANPSFTYAKGDDGRFYRVKPAGGATWSNITADTKFEIVAGETDKDLIKTDKKLSDLFKNFKSGKEIPQTELYFIPNVLAFAGSEKDTAANKAYAVKNNELGDKYTISRTVYGINVVDPDNIAFFDLNQTDIKFDSFTFNGETYPLKKDFNTENVLLEMDNIKFKNDIQQLPIELKYTVENGQSTADITDDDFVEKTAKVGEMRIYNLPYSYSFVTVNQQAVEDSGKPTAAPNNLFGFVGGERWVRNPKKVDEINEKIAKEKDPDKIAELKKEIADLPLNAYESGESGHYGAFQVAGLQTNAIPRSGRADYYGKSYGVNSKGDLHLTADFALERVGISGSVSKRTTFDEKTKLPSLDLGKINLVQQGKYHETASEMMQSTSLAKDGAVAMGGRAAGKWGVALYGPNAEEVGGIIKLDNASDADKKLRKNIEVFSGQRKEIGELSLDKGVGVTK